MASLQQQLVVLEQKATLLQQTQAVRFYTSHHVSVAEGKEFCGVKLNCNHPPCHVSRGGLSGHV